MLAFSILFETRDKRQPVWRETGFGAILFFILFNFISPEDGNYENLFHLALLYAARIKINHIKENCSLTSKCSLHVLTSDVHVYRLSISVYRSFALRTFESVILNFCYDVFEQN